MKAMQATLVEERRRSFYQKLKRAEVNRNLHLKNIQDKAHDEAKKLKEIAFINELEAQNRRHEFMALCQVRFSKVGPKFSFNRLGKDDEFLTDGLIL